MIRNMHCSRIEHLNPPERPHIGARIACPRESLIWHEHADKPSALRRFTVRTPGLRRGSARTCRPRVLTRRFASLFASKVPKTILSLVLVCLSIVFASTAQESVTTLAGSALVSGSQNGSGTNALFSDPTGLAIDAAGNLFIADNQNHVIRKFSTNGIVSTFAGHIGQSGSADGTGTNAWFNNPTGIAIAPNGNLYVTDSENHTIRCITSNAVVTTLAGLPGQNGATNATGNLARFDTPLGICVDALGTIYVADTGNHLIRKVTAAGAVTTLAGKAGVWGTNNGTGSAASFNSPAGIAIDSRTNLFVSDSNNHTIRKITPSGVVTTFAGTPGVDGTNDGPANIALFRKPGEIKIDRNNTIYVVDSFNHTIRRISTNAIVSTVAGQPGSRGAMDGFGSQALFFNPYGLAIDHNGNLRIADTYNQTIRFAYAPIAASLSRSPADGGFIISWQSIAGDSYQVQMQDAPGAPWQNLGTPVTATNSTASLTDITQPENARRLYRVKLMP